MKILALSPLAGLVPFFLRNFAVHSVQVQYAGCLPEPLRYRSSSRLGIVTPDLFLGLCRYGFPTGTHRLSYSALLGLRFSRFLLFLQH